MKRREFITLLGGAAAAWPLAARAQQPTVPVVGFLNISSPGTYARMVTAFRQGLNEAGYIEGRNVTIEYRWAENQPDRLPAMMADLVQRKVAVIAATSTPAALAAKAATTTIPIVFETGADPVQLGLVASLNRPGGNVTGVTSLTQEVVPKLLELLRELLPTARVIALLVNPADPAIAEANTSQALAAAHTLGLEVHVLNASSERDFEGVFAKLVELRAGGLVVGPEAVFRSHSEELAALAAHHGVPTVFRGREFTAAGGLMSYGSDLMDSCRLAGIYAGRILKGDKPADLPVQQQTTKVELFINLKTAKALGITVPLPLSGRADEIFE
jgi:putative tryptophan/tyrosine transport system substrate-binding protein